MQKKKLFSRLENLFVGLEEEAPLPPVRITSIPGWTWECDMEGRLSFCSPELTDHLGISTDNLLGYSIFEIIDPESAKLLKNLLDQNIFPVELEASMIVSEPSTPVRLTIFSKVNGTGQLDGWSGITQIISNGGDQPISLRAKLPLNKFNAPLEVASISTTQSIKGVSVGQGKVHEADHPWTTMGKQLLRKKFTTSSPSTTINANSIVASLPIDSNRLGILEVMSKGETHHWNEEDRLLVQEVTNQLLLALENARLYATVQQELSERVKAEQETLDRNRYLDSLNKIGQQLSRLTDREAIFDLVKTSVKQIVNCESFLIALIDQTSGQFEYPVAEIDNKTFPQLLNFLPSLIKHVLESRQPLLLTGDLFSEVQKLGIKIPASSAIVQNPVEQSEDSPQAPRTLLLIPMSSGEHNLGVIILPDLRQNAFSLLHVDLVSTIAAQATTSLENANLFQEINDALKTLEARERYQANATKAISVLSEFGTKALADVLTALGEGSQSGRVYYAQFREDESGIYWQPLAQWTKSEETQSFEELKLEAMPTTRHSRWIAEFKEKGWSQETSDKSSSLLIAIPGKNPIPSFLGFERLGKTIKWQSEEINILRIAADAFSNTIIREDLLNQLQSSLDETENLYNTSHQMALATDLQEMIYAITSGLPSSGLTSAVLLLFDYDNRNQLTRISVSSNWYSGKGTPPSVVGIEYPRMVYERMIFTPNSIFHDDILEVQMDNTLRDVFSQQNIRSLAVLPLWASKRQLGTLLLQYEDHHHFTNREIRSYPPLVDQMAIAVENNRLFQQTEKALSETELLYQISSSIAQAVDNRALVSLIGKLIMPKNADGAFLLEVTQNLGGEPTELEIFSLQDIPSRQARGSSHIQINSLPFIKDVSNDVVMYSDIAKSKLDAISKKTLQQMNINAAGVFPLYSSHQLLGVLMVTARRPMEFSQDEIRMLQVTGNGITVALERQRLLREAQRRALELETAAEIARDTTSTLSQDILLSRIVNLIYQRFSYYHVAIYLMDESNEVVSIQEAAGTAAEEIKKADIRFSVKSKTVIGQSIAQGIPEIVNDISQSELFIPNPLLPDTHSEVGIPLKSGYRVIGALDLKSSQINEFSSDVISVLQILADQIAVAIENARAYELSQKAYEDMREVERLKSQFLANMSHELRTPLNSIIGFSRVILKGIDGPVNDTQKQDLTAIYTSGQHLLNLINEVLDLSKIEAGKMTLSVEEINLIDLINSVMTTATGLVKDKTIEMIQNLPPTLPIIKADPTRVRQVIINFISNAAKFTEEGTITIDAKEVKGPTGRPEIMVSVTDTGQGISEDDKAKLFQPFSQVDDSPTRKTSGTGLGLSICRSLIELHKGRIGLAWSEVGIGSCFFFTLPLPEPVKSTGMLVFPDKNKIILSIEDDEQVINLYERYLGPQGYSVIPLTEPDKALAMVKKLKPFAITLDIMMPGTDGWTVLHELKNDPETKTIPVIICSIMEEEEKGINLGAADYLVKPFVQDELVNAINRLNVDGNIHNILVIDDDPEDLRLVEKIFSEDKRFKIKLVEGGQAGWQALKSNPPDAVILDLFMPELNGFDILERTRAEPVLSGIPVVILTGADLTAEQHNQLSSFGKQLMLKGYLNEKELLKSLEEALKKIKN
jgi:signal transduction histidine kinase/CheY-like chemotaxis protein